jgi:hypothetical protein
LLIFLLDIMTLWMLKKIGGVPKAEVKTSVQRFGSKLAITTSGLIGSFVAVAILVLGAIYFIARLMGP